ncbi:hypothetical protein EES42_32540 [Streptomyces sp. ADI95-17]|nr:hypothetical protein EES42_32540 [Streptomyces sp. ADI95-17]
MAQPWYWLRHTALADPTCFGWLLGDHDGLSRLAARLSFAARSRHTIVHIPLRDGVPMDGGYEHAARHLDRRTTSGPVPDQASSALPDRPEMMGTWTSK